MAIDNYPVQFTTPAMTEETGMTGVKFYPVENILNGKHLQLLRDNNRRFKLHLPQESEIWWGIRPECHLKR